MRQDILQRIDRRVDGDAFSLVPVRIGFSNKTRPLGRSYSTSRARSPSPDYAVTATSRKCTPRFAAAARVAELFGSAAATAARTVVERRSSFDLGLVLQRLRRDARGKAHSISVRDRPYASLVTKSWIKRVGVRPRRIALDWLCLERHAASVAGRAQDQAAAPFRTTFRAAVRCRATKSSATRCCGWRSAVCIFARWP